MRTISRLSAAFQLVDGGTKEPVLGASILVDGGRVRHIAKGDGTYVFSDLPPTAHTYLISAPGYCEECLTLPASPTRFPEVLPMRYAPGGVRLGKVAHFRLRLLEGEKPLQNAPFRVTLATNVGALRLVEDAGAGEWTLSLAGGFALGMLYQKYILGSGGEDTLLLTGYDRGTGRYELQDPLTAPLPQGTLLRPVWDLRTDRDGTAILPAIGLFLQREEAEFSFAWDGREQRLTTANPSPSCSLTIAF